MENCKECETKVARCKGLCGGCYSRARRKTPKGKAQMKRYQKSDKAKAAQKRFRESEKGKAAMKRFRDKQPKRIKPPNEDCKCGRPYVAKGMCSRCYQRARHGYTGKLRGKSRKSTPMSQYKYDFILDKVKLGYTIKESCGLAEVRTWNFYNSITDIQKQEIRSYKAVFSNSTRGFKK